MVERALHPRTPPALAETTLAGSERVRIFVLSITDRCNIACDFCCHPYMNSELSKEDSIRLVDEAVELDFSEIAVTGGEPLLRKKLILELARICRRKGKLFGLITNAFWAGTPVKAEAWARELREAGVTRVTVSWDPSHGAFVPAANAQNAIDACVGEGLKVTLTGSFKVPGDDHAKHGIDVTHLVPYRNFLHFESPAAPAGNGEDVGDIDSRPCLHLQDGAMICPSQSPMELVVYSQDGLTQPCCSIFAGYKLKAIHLGDWRELSVKTLLERQAGDAFFQIVREGGFKRIYDIVSRRDPELYAQLPGYGAASSTCHFCAVVMGGPHGPRVRRLLNDHLAERVGNFWNLFVTSRESDGVDRIPSQVG